jgi:hypothetical protein
VRNQGVGCEKIWNRRISGKSPLRALNRILLVVPLADLSPIASQAQAQPTGPARHRTPAQHGAEMLECPENVSVKQK